MTWTETIDLQRKEILCNAAELSDLAHAMDRLSMPLAKDLRRIANNLTGYVTAIECAVNVKLNQDLKLAHAQSKAMRDIVKAENGVRQ